MGRTVLYGVARGLSRAPPDASTGRRKLRDAAVRAGDGKGWGAHHDSGDF
jgi:hypothetical protein